MTHKERTHRAITLTGPDYPPAWCRILAATWLKYRDALVPLAKRLDVEACKGNVSDKCRV